MKKIFALLILYFLVSVVSVQKKTADSLIAVLGLLPYNEQRIPLLRQLAYQLPNP